MCRRRKVTGTLTVRQGRRQCPEESREGYHCGRQNFRRHSKEMMAELSGRICINRHPDVRCPRLDPSSRPLSCLSPLSSRYPWGLGPSYVSGQKLWPYFWLIFSDIPFTIHQHDISALSSKYILMTLRKILCQQWSQTLNPNALPPEFRLYSPAQEYDGCGKCILWVDPGTLSRECWKIRYRGRLGSSQEGLSIRVEEFEF